MEIQLAELEQAINYWRRQCPSQGEERALSAQVNALAKVYALMIYHRRQAIALTELSPTARELFEAAQHGAGQ